MKKWIWNNVSEFLDWLDPYWSLSNLIKLVALLLIVWLGHSLMH